MTSVLIIDRDPMCRRLLELFVQDSGRYTVAGSAADFTEAAAVFPQGRAGLLLVDADSLFETTVPLPIRARKTIVMAAHPEYHGLRRARQKQADSFWYKEPSAESLLEIMDRTMDGESVYPLKDARAWIGTACTDDLTTRELDVLSGIVCGMTDAAIAEKYDMSTSTVKYHISNVREKTNFSTRTALAVGAQKSGFIRGKL